MTKALIRRADHADLAAITQLRREWTHEPDPHDADPGFGERFADWFARESARRITWPAEADGRPAGMMNLYVREDRDRWSWIGAVGVLRV
jgi:hypothetical protein